MATTKLGLVTLLLCGIIVVVGSQVKQANAQKKACTRECNLRAKYRICPATGEASKLDNDKGCTNCCEAENDGCILYDHNGTPFCPKEPPLSPN